MTQGTHSIRRSAFWGALAFCGVFAIVVGVRLEQAALTAIVGVVCGVAASIPTSLLIVALLHKQDDKRYRRDLKRASQPHVVVVTPQSLPQTQRQDGWPAEYALPVPGQRQFSIIGEDEVTDV
jgi:hypothetical protein